MKYGYARVSKQDQNLDMQLDALKKAGCDKIFKEKMSAGKAGRLQLEALLSVVKAGDIIVIWKLARLGRSLKELVQISDKLRKEDITLMALAESLDTSTVQGRFFFNMMAALAEHEREEIIERTRAGLDAARARGRKGGRPKGLPVLSQLKAVKAKKMYASGGYTISQILKELSISKPTLYKYLRADLGEEKL